MLLRVGVLLIVLSLLPWIALAALPFLGLGGARAAATAGGLVIAAEVLFWCGLALAGRETWQTARAHGWRAVPRELWRLLLRGRREGRTSAAG